MYFSAMHRLPLYRKAFVR